MAISELGHLDDSDLGLIDRARAGDNDAFTALHTRHVGAALALARSMSRSRSDADDLVSEAFTRVLSALRAGRGPDLAFRPYLLTTLRRVAYDRTVRDRREVPTEDELVIDLTGHVEDPVVAGLDRSLAAEAFASLPERWRTVLWHTEVEGQRPAEVAALLGIQPNAVAALAYRAREGLRQAFLSKHVVPGSDRECGRAADRLGPYVRGGLGPAQTRQVDEHLQRCAACRASYLELLEVNTDLRAIVGLLVLGPAAAAYLEARGATPARSIRGDRTPVPRVALLVGALAALAVAFATGAYAADQGRGLEQGVRVVQGAAVRGSLARHSSSPDGGASASDGPGRGSSPGTAPAGRGRAVAYHPPSVRDPGAPHVPPPPAGGSRPPARRGGRGWPGPLPAALAPPGTAPLLPVPRPHLVVSASAVGSVLAGRSGVLAIVAANVGQATAAAPQLDVSLAALRLRALDPDLDGWRCIAAGPTAAHCTGPALAAGAERTLYLPVDAAAGSGTSELRAAVSTPTPVTDPGDQQVGLPITRVPTGMSARFAAIAHGAVAAIGNNLLSCPAEQPGCLDARARVPGSHTDDNDWVMAPVDTDGDPATSISSSATLHLPAGAQVLSAQLHWGADLTAGSGGVAAAPAGSPAVGRAGLRHGGSPVVPIGADHVDQVGERYQAVADVTDLVRAGGSGRWTLSDVQAATGADRSAGWSLVVAYRLPSLPERSLLIFDGLVGVGAGQSSAFAIGGYRVSPGGTHATVGVVAYEGDAGFAGDQLSVDGMPLVDAANPSGNTFNGTISDPFDPLIGRQPADANTFGFDLDVFDASRALAPGSTSATISSSTADDTYFDGVVFAAVDR